MSEIAAPAPGAGTVADGAQHLVLGFVARRLLTAIATLLVVSALVFAGTEVLPGDAASAVLGKTATPQELAKMQRLMGLDRPAHERYLDWLGGLVSGDLGNSAAGYASGVKSPVWDSVSGKLTNSLVLAGVTALLMIPLSLLLGALAAVRAGRAADHAISLTSLAVISLPEFIIGSLLILVFFSWLDVLPPVSLVAPGESPLAKPSVLVLPVLTLLGASLGASTRMVRAGMLETLRSDYVQAARLNGIAGGRILWRYALRNAMAPAVQVLAQNLQYLVGGIVVTEYLFAYPGLGKELVDAVAIRDVREVQSLAVLVAAIYIGLNIVADLLVVMLVPKLRTGR
jgi:peptide/nickel transport system permease protein